MVQEVKLSDKSDLKNDFAVPSYKDWKKQVEKDLKGESFDEKLITKTYEKINLQPLYTSDDIKDIPQVNNFPGFATYVRGNNASGYKGCSWK